MEIGVRNSLYERYLKCSLNLKILADDEAIENKLLEDYQKIVEDYLYKLCIKLSKSLEKFPYKFLNKREETFLYIEKSFFCCYEENQKKLFYEEFYTSADISNTV